MDVDSNGVVFAAKRDVIYKSLDGGVTFNQISILPGSIALMQRVYIDTRNYIFTSGFATSEHGLYRSVDSGETWTKVISLDANCCIWAIEEDESGHMYAGEYSRLGAGSARIWKSVDGGENWVEKYSHDTGVSQDHIHDIRYNPTSRYIYATYGDTDSITIIRSIDSGETWATVSSTGSRLLAMAISGNYVYIGSDTGNGNKIYRFSDNGSPSVTLETVYTFGASQDSQVFCAGEYGQKMFFGTWTPTQSGTVEANIVVFDGNAWEITHSVKYPIGYEGFWNVSRHNIDGTFFISNGNELGIRLMM